MENKVMEIVAEQFDIEVEKLSLETNFINDLEADSLDVVQIIVDLETEFDIEVEESAVKKITTIKSVLDYLKTLI